MHKLEKKKEGDNLFLKSVISLLLNISLGEKNPGVSTLLRVSLPALG